ncbi:MAG: NAD-dependent epimerase/dehydratase family protein [Gammaproteobacteria bacterium]|jgi:UDP-glucose 4-epimerase|nr:NAD-dependent epimerase/dehydratase family protein [Gammaproteobacteria bacterium]MBT4606951.1 NAD-dependent epimerase/dehydratase family protein [Thiotrichales bacterium]MBT3471305.1 NAD-dependent epimerase/dehydratase family protein [Gammaproteobacteria bacterium]MBT3968670.1 NAD-dependent epimerase/dehydratase family protein [Gammaproteobacteria bacterium]MBT4080260.1 NAD-dependent epimerase/dehydratase family protein [Gammaproteobacteria bacterium]
MPSYLITGGCGFIGSHLADRLLAQGHRVRILDNLSTGSLDNVPSQCEVQIGDVTRSEQVQSAMEGMDGCFHLAAIASVQQSIEEWSETHRVNVTGTVNVLDAARKGKRPVVYASSAAVYGDNADMPLRESAAIRPLTAYGADKASSEMHARVASLVHGVPTIGMRFFNVYGPRQNPSSPYSGVISIFVDRMLRGKKRLDIFGDGLQTRDFVYVSDVVDALCMGMQQVSTNPAVFNVCTGKETSILQLAQTLTMITRSRVELVHEPKRYGDIRISIGDPKSLKRALGVQPQTGLAQGLRALIDAVFNEIAVEQVPLLSQSGS